jgi:hypothetical protein
VQVKESDEVIEEMWTGERGISDWLGLQRMETGFRLSHALIFRGVINGLAIIVSAVARGIRSLSPIICDYCSCDKRNGRLLLVNF